MQRRRWQERRAAAFSRRSAPILNYFPATADTARVKPPGKRFVRQRKFRATHSGPIFVGGAKRFCVAST